MRQNEILHDDYFRLGVISNFGMSSNFDLNGVLLQNAHSTAAAADVVPKDNIIIVATATMLQASLRRSGTQLSATIHLQWNSPIAENPFELN